MDLGTTNLEGYVLKRDDSTIALVKPSHPEKRSHRVFHLFRV